MPLDVDLLILGGGCAGLSLAMQLAQRGQCAPSTLILEQRVRYENDRTWCFWGDDKTPFAQQAAHQWSMFKVAYSGTQQYLDCTETPYRMLCADQFYTAATQAFATVPQMQLNMASPLHDQLQFSQGRWHGETKDGAFSARIVVDTRPQRTPGPDGALLWQSFYGLEIDFSQPAFEPNCVELMSFQPAAVERVGFTYVLPLSAKRALVEFTVFAETPFDVNALTLDLHRSIAQRVNGAAFKVLRSENGILPMGLTRMPVAVKSAEPTYVHVGLLAGAARPATGYAFQRIQRWAVDCEKAITQIGLPVGHPKEPVLRSWMDTLFLRVIRRHPELAPQLFMALFSGLSSQRIIRFLGESGKTSDLAALAWALPHTPFLQELFRRPNVS